MKSFGEIVKLIEDARNNALKKVNEELITLYWKVGQYVSQKSASAEWGEGIVDQLAEFIKSNYPQIKGFNRRGLYRMKQFYEAYRDNEFVSPLVTQISWSNPYESFGKTYDAKKYILTKEDYHRLFAK